MLVWVQDKNTPTWVSKGKCYLLEFCRDLDDVDQEDEEWIAAHEPNPRVHAPNGISECLHSTLENSTICSSSSCAAEYRSFEWADLNVEAHALNQQHLSDEEISVQELDVIIDKCKQERQQDSIWTWDDWLTYVMGSPNDNGNSIGSSNDDIDIKLVVLEAAMPLRELHLHQPTYLEQHVLQVPPAPDWIRCTPADEESDDEDDNNPSSDGVGLYLDYVYRRFMGEMLTSVDGSGNSTTKVTNS
jgi:hypothetical protein